MAAPFTAARASASTRRLSPFSRPGWEAVRSGIGDTTPMAKVGDVIDAENAGWNFGAGVAEHFDAHVSRQVPFYHEGHALVAEISDFFLPAGGVCVELGCSTGALLSMLANRQSGRGRRFIGIDVEPAMVGKARERCASLADVSIIQGDLAELDVILDTELGNNRNDPSVEHHEGANPDDAGGVDFMVAYYTLQFVHPRVRQSVYNAIWRRLNWGGAFVLFEKVRAPDARFQDLATAVYNDFKLANGYSGDEILAKARSLKGVLEPFSSAGNLGLLERAGFVDIMSLFKYVCFEGVLAVK